MEILMNMEQWWNDRPTGEGILLEGRKWRLSNRCVSTAVESVVLVRILWEGYFKKNSDYYEYIKKLRICAVMEELGKDSGIWSWLDSRIFEVIEEFLKIGFSSWRWTQNLTQGTYKYLIRLKIQIINFSTTHSWKFWMFWKKLHLVWRVWSCTSAAHTSSWRVLSAGTTLPSSYMIYFADRRSCLYPGTFCANLSRHRAVQLRTTLRTSSQPQLVPCKRSGYPVSGRSRCYHQLRLWRGSVPLVLFVPSVFPLLAVLNTWILLNQEEGQKHEFISLILWNNQQMELYAVNFIPLLSSLYMFRAPHTPIIRSTMFNCIYSHWYEP